MRFEVLARERFDDTDRAEHFLDEVALADQHNNLLSTTDALSRATRYEYDAAGNIASMTDARNDVTRYEYDGNNRRTRTIHPDNTVDVTTYDGAGRTTSKTDQAGRVTRFEYDKMGRLLKVIDAADNATTATIRERARMAAPARERAARHAARARDRRPRQPRDAEHLRGGVQGESRQEGRPLAGRARAAGALAHPARAAARNARRPAST